MKYLLLLFFNAFLVGSFAQELPTRPNYKDAEGKKQGEWIYYFNEEWEELPDSTNAEFYRLILYKDSKPIGKVIDYYKSGMKQFQVDSLVSEDPLVMEGILYLYTESGNIHLVEVHKDGKMDTTQAILLFKELIDRYKKEIPDHLDLAKTANDLAYLYRVNKDYPNAEKYYTMAVEIRKKAAGPTSFLYANSCHKLGWIYMVQDKFTEAEPMLRESVKLFKVIGGPDDERYLSARDHLAHVYKSMGKNKEAEDLYK